MAFIVTKEHDEPLENLVEFKEPEKKQLNPISGERRDIEQRTIEALLKFKRFEDAQKAGLTASHFNDKTLADFYESCASAFQKSGEVDKFEQALNLRDCDLINEAQFDRILELDDLPDTESTGVHAIRLIGEVISISNQRRADDLLRKAQLHRADGDDRKAAELAQKAAQLLSATNPAQSENGPAVVTGMDGMPLNFKEAKQMRPEVIVEGLLYARSKMLVGGAAKAGKSHFVMDLVASLSRGQSFLKWSPSREFKVLYVDFELHDWELNERCGKAFDWNVPENFGRLSLRSHYGVRSPDSIGKLFEQIDASKWDVVILDCLYKFNQVDDENDNSQMQAVCAWMDKIITQHEITPILIHHFGKGSQGGKSVIDRFRGASSLVGDMDAILSLTPHEEDKNIIVETEVRSFAPTEPFVVRWDYPNFIIDESKDASKHAKPGAKKKMSSRDFLAFFPDKSSAKTKEEMCHKLGISESTFRRKLSEFNEIKLLKDESVSGRPKNRYYVSQ